MMRMTTLKKKTTPLRSLTHVPRKMLWALVMEGVETKEMVHVFLRHGKGRLLGKASTTHPSPEEIRQAKEQLKDLPKFLPFFVIIVAPVPGIAEGYVLLAATLEKWLGNRVSLLPSQFKKVFRKPADPSVVQV